MMNKVNLVYELDEWAKSEFGFTFEVVMDCNHLTLVADDESVAWFVKFKKYDFNFAGSNDCDLNVRLIKEGIIEKFYDKAIELLNEYEPKYTVKLIINSDVGYLNFDNMNKVYSFSNNQQSHRFKTQFSENELNNLKKSKNIAIDWTKALIEEVKE